jgi:hypothetical protein
MKELGTYDSFTWGFILVGDLTKNKDAVQIRKKKIH